MFRLLNVFSERFYQAFLSSGNQLSRSKLDQGGSTFWTDVAVEFNGMDIEFDLLISDDGVSLVWIHRSPWHTQLQNSSKCGLKLQATLLVQRPPPRRLATTVMTSGISVLDERTWSEHRGSGQCTKEDGTRLIQIIRDRDDESDEDFDDVNYDAELEEIIKSTTY
ncbi:hypothetical protein L915_21087 [Phytophthora nicotianae]|uniref:Uncharacterized protein n=1 Tax=Phytophthora nicotianae TaxID=4792 RepID=W2FM03_PHYNI|nr:hypothetical protein L915_21087 [Phytophthora nicotianae]